MRIVASELERTRQRPSDEAWQDLHTLLAAQLLAVPGPEMEGYPYASLPAFAATPDLKRLLFTIARATLKNRDHYRRRSNLEEASVLEVKSHTP